MKSDNGEVLIKKDLVCSPHSNLLKMGWMVSDAYHMTKRGHREMVVTCCLLHCKTLLFTRGSRGQSLDLVQHVKLPSNPLMTVPRWYFCCGSSVLHVMSVCKWYSAISSIV